MAADRLKDPTAVAVHLSNEVKKAPGTRIDYVYFEGEGEDKQVCGLLCGVPTPRMCRSIPTY